LSVGEYEFGELFGKEAEREKLQYKPVLILFFVTFLVVMTIVLMNMLTGLAVDNIKGIQEGS
jgi:transient receptor potential cation channel subfamily A protein 1